MSFTDLSNIAQQVPQQRPQLTLQQQQDLQAQSPPDPRSFQPLPPTNLPSRAFQQTASIAGVDPTRTNEAADLENTGAAAQEKKPEDQETAWTPPLFVPSVYRKPTDNRGASGWGQDWPPNTMALAYPGLAPGPDMPSPKESYDETKQAGAFLGRFGAPSYAEPAQQMSFLATPLAAILDAFSHGKFSQNYTAAALRGIYIQQAQMQMAQGQYLQQHQQFLLEAGSILNQITPATTAQEMTQIENQLRDFLHRTGHDYLMGLLNNHDIRGVVNHLNMEDQQYRRILGANTQLKKSLGTESNADTMRSWGYEGGGLGGGGALGADLPAQRTAPEAPQTDATGAGPYPQPPPGSFNAELAQRYGLSPRALQAVDQRFNGTEPEGYADLNKSGAEGAALHDRIAQGVMAKQARADQIVSGAGTAPDKFAKLKQLSPEFGTRLEGYYNYSLDPLGEEAKAKGNLPHILAMLKQIDPDWDAGNYKLVHQLTDQKGDPQKLLTGAGNMNSAYLMTMAPLNRLQSEGKSIPRKWLENWAAGHVTGTPPEYAAIGNRLVAFEVEASRELSLTGTTRVSILNKLLEHVGPTASAEQIREVMQSEMAVAWRDANHYQDIWSSTTKRDGLIPGFTTNDFETLRAIVRQNTRTGHFPKGDDVPNEVSAVDQRGPVNPRYKDEPEPLSMEQIWKLQDLITRNAHSQDPAMQEWIAAAKAAIGPLQGITKRVPGVDPSGR